MSSEVEGRLDAAARRAVPPEGRAAADQAARRVRFAFVDALRGLAAAWVAGFHFYGGLSQHFRRAVFPAPLHSLLRHGNCGVEIFFVLSGFVIAYAVRRHRVDAQYAGNFLLRRSIRLEPPYWATIILAIGIGVLSNQVRHDRVKPFPSVPQIAAHLFYLQGLLRYEQIVDVFWTLCIEVQFYASFLLMLAIAQRCSRHMLTFMPLGLLSLGVYAGLIESPHSASMVKFWWFFQLGVFAWWALSGVIRPQAFWSFIGTAFLLVVYRPAPESITGLMTALSLYWLGRLGVLEHCLAFRPLQFLGKISYSLYLTHPVVGVPFTYYLAAVFLGHSPSAGMASVFFLAAFAASVLAATVLYGLVERPAQYLSRHWVPEKQTLSNL